MTIVYLFVSKRGKGILDAISIKNCTYIHIVRVPVEIVLYFLLLEKTIPKSMTFEGVNFDIFIGLSAPFIIYFGYIKKRLSKKVILIWYFIGLIMVLNVFVIGILSAPFPLQQLAFNQSNIAMLHFPYSLLPIFIVPAVIFAHLVSIRQLFFNKMII